MPAVTLESPGLFRLGLAVWVFVSHVSRVNLGAAAVYLFFALSGFWIHAMWTRRYLRARSPYQTYLVSRAWRLIPTFILCTVICWGLVFTAGLGPDAPPVARDYAHQLFSNLFIFGYASLPFQPIIPAWSLDIEAQFYIVAPLLIALIARSWWALAGCVGISLAVAILGLAGYLTAYREYLPAYLIFFAAGIAAGAWGWNPGRGLAWGCFAAMALLLALCWFSPFRTAAFYGAHPGLYTPWNPVVNVIAGLAVIPLAILTTRRPSSGFDHMLGDLSYIFYLLHWRMMRVLDIASGGYGRRALAIAGVCALTLGASWLIWRLFDRPLNRRRAAWVAARIREEGMAIRSTPAPMARANLIP